MAFGSASPQESLIEGIEDYFNTRRALWCEFLNSSERAYASPEFVRLYGYQSLEEMPRRRIDLVHEQDRLRVLKTLTTARHTLGKMVVSVFRIRTKQGLVKTIFAQAIQLEVKGKRVLASFHTDISDAYAQEPGSEESPPLGLPTEFLDEVQGWRTFYQRIIDTIPGYVFIKERVCEGDTLKFVFRYVNQPLVEVFGANTMADVLGTTDSDWFTYSREIGEFENRDEEVCRTHQAVPVTIEDFTPKRSGLTRKLATIKVPLRTRLLNESGSLKTYVLGIAVDVSTHISLLLAVMENLEDAIYIKDAEGRYQLVNDAFVRLVGQKDTREILNRTIDEIAGAKAVGTYDQQDIKAFLDTVHQQDQTVLRGQEIDALDQAIFDNRRLYREQKRPIKTLDGHVRHILGISSPFDKWHRFLREEIWDHLPQHICVKDEKLCVRFCNASYAKRHGYHRTEEVIGKSDVDFWSEEDFPEQAKKYQEDDREVLNLAMQIESCQQTDQPNRLAKFRRQLSEFDGYTESQSLPDGSKRLIFTRKWPLNLGGKWYVAVVYEDITLEEEKRRWIVHAVRNEVAPYVEATRHLQELIALGFTISIPQLQTDVLDLLWRGGESLESYLQSCLSTIGHHIRYENLEFMAIGTILQNIVIDFQKTLGDKLELTINFQPSNAEAMEVRGNDKAFTIAIKELLRNATRAIRAFQQPTPSGPCVCHGSIRIVVQRHADRVDIIVADNGCAGQPGLDRQLLEERFRSLERKDAWGFSGFGIGFVDWVVKQHHGQVRLLPLTSLFETQILVQLPINDI